MKRPRIRSKNPQAEDPSMKGEERLLRRQEEGVDTVINPLTPQSLIFLFQSELGHGYPNSRLSDMNQVTEVEC